jgi:drug/metabolite transporter (DMT)-like permease
MTAIQFHLAVVHLPVLALLAGASLLLAARMRRSEFLFKMGCGFLLAAALGAAAAYFSGPRAYETLKGFDDQLSRRDVESHAALGKGAFMAMVLLGLASGLALIAYAQDERPSPWLRWILLIGAFLLLYMLAWTAYLGGLIRHPEVSPSFRSIFPRI